MKNFALLALVATLARAQENDEKPVEPDNSNFPDEWSHDTCQAEQVEDGRGLQDQCKSTVVDRDIKEVAEYSEEL